ncbi:MAG: sigma-70 family RNA polymerase sigma factor, partial [Pseudomonadota bacterium]
PPCGGEAIGGSDQTAADRSQNTGHAGKPFSKFVLALALVCQATAPAKPDARPKFPERAMARQPNDPALTTYIGQRDDLIALAHSIVGNAQTAEDVVQDSWLRWIGKSYPKDRAAPILRRIVANLAKDWHRSSKVEERAMREQALLHDPSLDSERIVMARQDLAEVVSILNELPERTLAAFRMHRLEGLTYREIGVRLEIGTTRVHQLVQAALVHVALRRNGH